MTNKTAAMIALGLSLMTAPAATFAFAPHSGDSKMNDGKMDDHKMADGKMADGKMEDGKMDDHKMDSADNE